MVFPTLAFNEEMIINIIDILQTFAKWLGPNKKMVHDKIIIIKGNLIIIKNVTQIIFQRRMKLMQINRFDWLEPTTRLFHLEINPFIIMFPKFCAKPKNIASPCQYARILKQSKISKDMKNFHVCDIFFKHGIEWSKKYWYVLNLNYPIEFA